MQHYLINREEEGRSKKQLAEIFLKLNLINIFLISAQYS
jgi:hypothetical protein